MVQCRQTNAQDMLQWEGTRGEPRNMHSMFNSRVAKDAGGHRLLLVSRFLESCLGWRVPDTGRLWLLWASWRDSLLL